MNHPDVDLVAFTGSREIGLLINRQAADTRPGQDHVKRVIAEMGGKNAIIVDDDADLDEAVVGVVQSAFGYSGQKCSACSRVIVLEGFTTRSWPGSSRPLEPSRSARPISPKRSSDRSSTPRPAGVSWSTSSIAAQEGRVVLDARCRRLADVGTYVGPSSWPMSRHAPGRPGGDLRPGAGRAQGQRSGRGPADRQRHPYALTGGVYSRSPVNIDRVRREFKVGNLYINRGITGALVDRHPFGGFKLSGIGTKAGGSDYLLEFLLTRSITENTIIAGGLLRKSSANRNIDPPVGSDNPCRIRTGLASHLPAFLRCSESARTPLLFREGPPAYRVDAGRAKSA